MMQSTHFADTLTFKLKPLMFHHFIKMFFSIFYRISKINFYTKNDLIKDVFTEITSICGTIKQALQ
jgi:hypothetical protein